MSTLTCIWLFGVACAASTSADSGETSKETEPPEETGTTETDDSGGPEEDETTLAIDFAVAVGGFRAQTALERLEFGAQAASTGAIVPVHPGTWWVTAWEASDGAAERCDVSPATDLGFGDTLYWEVVLLPGTLDDDGDCVLP